MSPFKALASICVMAVSVTTFAADAPENVPIYVSPRLEIAPADNIQSAIAKPFEEPIRVMVRRGETRTESTIRSCADYIKQSGGAIEADTNQETKALQYLGVRCMALEEIRRAKPANRSFLPKATESISGRYLPPQLAVHVAKEVSERVLAIASLGQSIVDMEPSVKVQPGIIKAGKLRPGKKDALALSGMGWAANITIYARGDFNGDGVEDLLLRRDGWLEGGTYGVSELFVLSRTKNGEVLRVVRAFPEWRQ